MFIFSHTVNANVSYYEACWWLKCSSVYIPDKDALIQHLTLKVITAVQSYITSNGSVLPIIYIRDSVSSNNVLTNRMINIYEKCKNDLFSTSEDTRIMATRILMSTLSTQVNEIATQLWKVHPIAVKDSIKHFKLKPKASPFFPKLIIERNQRLNIIRLSIAARILQRSIRAWLYNPNNGPMYIKAMSHFNQLVG
jgi:hypothetical protein